MASKSSGSSGCLGSARDPAEGPRRCTRGPRRAARRRGTDAGARAWASGLGRVIPDAGSSRSWASGAPTLAVTPMWTRAVSSETLAPPPVLPSLFPSLLSASLLSASLRRRVSAAGAHGRRRAPRRCRGRGVRAPGRGRAGGADPGAGERARGTPRDTDDLSWPRRRGRSGRPTSLLCSQPHQDLRA